MIVGQKAAQAVRKTRVGGLAGEHHGKYAVNAKAAKREGERQQRGPVGPMGVIDNQRDGSGAL